MEKVLFTEKNGKIRVMKTEKPTIYNGYEKIRSRESSGRKDSVPMEYEPEKKRISILKKIAFPLLIVALLQPLVFLASLQGSDIIGKSNKEECSDFSGRVSRAGEDLSSEMSLEWADLELPQKQLDAAYASFCSAKGLTDAAFAKSDSAQQTFLKENAAQVLDTMRRNQTTGAYLILNGKNLNTGTTVRNGICIRDDRQNGSYREPEELYLKRGSADIAEKLSIPTRNDWAANYTIAGNSGDFFFTRPLLAASQHPKTPEYDLGYWCSSYSLDAQDSTGLSYSIPLVSGNGNVYGVFGVEISQKYLTKNLPTRELGTGTCYSLATVREKNGKTVYDLTIPKSGTLKKILGSSTSFTAGKQQPGGCWRTEESDFPGKVIFSAAVIQEKNARVSGAQTLALVGITSTETLFAFSHQVQNLLIVALFFALVVGILGMLTVSCIISSPMIEMSERIRGMDDHETAQLEGIGISEVDALIDSINHLNQNVAKNEERLSTILKLTNYPIGVFSIDLESGYVYSSSGLFYILRGLIQPEDEKELSDLNNFVRMLDKLRQCPTEIEESGSALYDICPYVGTHRWIRVRETEQEDSLLGVVTDVTAEVQHKKQIEYERDYDPLTKLINRHAFQTMMEKLSRTPEELGMAAMVMFDVDGLKAINDKYGHDCGDRYICSIANVLKKLEGPGAIVSHISGDEFVALLYHRDSKEEIRSLVSQIQKKEEDAVFEFPDGTTGKLCLSGGLAWYPTDSTDLSILRRYADFTLYQAKERFRGTVVEFDAKQYYQDNLGERRKELERILAGEGLQCALHPVVHAVGGELAGFEAPIAPKSGVLITDEDLLVLARSQEKLYQVEQVNWKTALTAFQARLSTLPEDGKLFIRTVPGQYLLPADYEKLILDSGVPARRLVPLVKIDECCDSGRGAKKVQSLCKFGLDLGLVMDTDSAVLSLEGLSLENFRYLVLSPRVTHLLLQPRNGGDDLAELLEEAESRGMQVVCQGVNTREEFRTLRRMEIPLLQGPLMEKNNARFPFTVK
jgi:diguanylate cyclase (GGDEF)-like protein